MNPIIEGHKRLDDWFNKVETLLDENVEVIGKLLVPKPKDNDASLNGSN